MSPDFVAGALVALGFASLVYGVAVAIAEGLHEWRRFGARWER